MDPSYGYIYLIHDSFTKKVYIGQKKGSPEKTQKYLGSGRIITQIITKRKHHLSKRILGYCGTKEELDEAEKMCIEFYQSNNGRYGYNLSSGGEWGATFTGKKHTPETKLKMSKSMLGKKRSFESRQNMSKARKISHNTDATKKKISACKKGKKLSQEHKTKIGLSGRLPIDVMQILDMYYNKHLSMRKIAKLLNCSYSPIRQRIRFTEKYTCK